jgi:hypothetical protein
MRKREREKILAEYRSMSDADLLKEYQSTLQDSLGSEAEIMEERGWDEADVRDRRAYEKWIGEKNQLAETVLDERGIDAWTGKKKEAVGHESKQP